MSKYTTSVDGKKRKNIITKTRFTKEDLESFMRDVKFLDKNNTSCIDVLSSIILEGIYRIQCEADDERNRLEMDKI